MEKPGDLSPQQVAKLYANKKCQQALLEQAFFTYWTPEKTHQFFEKLWERHENGHEASTRIIAGFLERLAKLQRPEESGAGPVLPIQVNFHAADLEPRRVANLVNGEVAHQ